jgi:adenylate cyclase
MTDGETTPEAVDLRLILVDLGVPTEAVEQAAIDGTLELLALEKVVSLEEARFDIDEVAALSATGPDRIRAYWRALGFPDPRPGEKIFTESDVELLSAVVSFIAEGTLDPELALQMSRVIGSAMNKIATAQVDTLEVRRDARSSGEAPAFVGSARSTAELLSLMPKIMELVWRRQLAGAARRRMMRAAESDAGTGVLVGFADLVGFTAKTQQLSEHELAEAVHRFETVAYDTVARHAGRVVKMIGDEVMFLHDDPHEGAELALELAERFRDDPDLSDVRVGLAYGPVLEREGDVYGHVVNLANRIVSVAYPGTVVVSPEVHAALAPDTDLLLRALRSHFLKDIGRVPLWRLRRTADTTEAPYARARHRRSQRRFLEERRSQVAEAASQRAAHLPDGLELELLAPDGAGAGPASNEPTTGEFEALTEAVLSADLDPDLQVTLISDVEVARRLRQLEHEAQAKAAEADLEAEARLDEIEREARHRVEEAERDARRKVEAVLAKAEEESHRIREQASRKVERVAEEAQRKADKAARSAKSQAERKTRRRSRRPPGDGGS